MYLLPGNEKYPNGQSIKESGEFLLIKQKGFVFRIENLYWNTSFRFRLGIRFVKWCRTFCHVIKLMKYHVTKRPGRSPGARIQRFDSMSEPGNEFQ